MKVLAALVLVLTMLGASCGGDDVGDLAAAIQASEASTASDTAQASDQDDNGAPAIGVAQEVIPEAPGSLEMNTIRVGSQVWRRTLPMTTGQCFLYEADGTLPTSGVVWGTLDGDDEIGFSAGMNQDGTFEARLDDQTTFFYTAGPRNGTIDDLIVELDFDTLTIKGQGVFTNAFNGQSVHGSFEFQCES